MEQERPSINGTMLRFIYPGGAGPPRVIVVARNNIIRNIQTPDLYEKLDGLGQRGRR